MSIPATITPADEQALAQLRDDDWQLYWLYRDLGRTPHEALQAVQKAAECREDE